MNTPSTAYGVGLGQSPSEARPVSEQLRAANLLFRIENVPFCKWHTKARIVMGSATLFDAFDALSLAFVLPVLVGLWHLSPGKIGVLIAAGYLGQVVGALVFGWLAERHNNCRCHVGNERRMRLHRQPPYAVFDALPARHRRGGRSARGGHVHQ